MRDFSFEFEYLPGSANAAADTLSRAPVYYVSALELAAEARNTRDLGWKEVCEAADNDTEYQTKIQQVKSEGRNREFTLVDQKVVVDKTGRVLVPQSSALQNKLILEAHEPPFCGHLGVKRTCERLAEGWRWASLKTDVKRIIKVCDICQHDHSRSKKDMGAVEYNSNDVSMGK